MSGVSKTIVPISQPGLQPRQPRDQQELEDERQCAVEPGEPADPGQQAAGGREIGEAVAEHEQVRRPRAIEREQSAQPPLHCHDSSVGKFSE
jgi:hypothetical protein